MSCHELHGWSFPALVGAFVDLAVAHFLLLAAATTFLASRLLSLLGLRLPCPCSLSPHWCTRILLSHGPHIRIASVHSSIAARHPLLACWTCLPILTGEDARLKIGFCEIGDHDFEKSCGSARRDALLIGGGRGKIGVCEGGNGDLGVGVDESCVSVERDVLLMGVRGGEEAWGDVSSFEGMGEWRSRVIRRRMRKKGGCGDGGAAPLGWQESGSVDPPVHGDGGASLRRMSEGSNSPMYFRGNHTLRGKMELSGSSNIRLVEHTSSDEFGGEDTERNDIDTEIPPDPNRSSEETIRILRKALEKEQSARAALCLELEKERNASATATDEAVAMIERLQTEKASIDMNAKQYQRMIEEKTAYDEEEMGLMKEIIIRRERELFVMSEEVEMYRKMVLSCGTERLEDFDENFETMELSTHMSNALRESETSLHVFQSTKMKDDYESVYTSYDIKHDSSEGSPTPVNQNVGKSMNSHTSYSKLNISTNDDQLDFQEKDIVSVDMYMSPIQNRNLEIANLGPSRQFDSPRELLWSVDTSDNYEDIQRGNLHLGAVWKKGPEERSKGSGSYIEVIEAEPRTFDVHVIDDKRTVSREQSVKDDAPDILSDHSRRSWTAEEPDIQRSCSDASRTPSLSILTPPLDLRRSSMSAVDIERSKLEMEVDHLRRRLMTVQQGRQKLNFSVEHVEKDNFHHQLLDEIALQLHEIKQITEPQKDIRQTSLPPLSSKVSTKRRRGRSVSRWSST